MKLKSFFANTTEETIRLARHKLGPDALGRYEVVVCGDGPEPRPNEHRPVGPRAAVSPLRVDELKQRLKKLALTLAHSGRGGASVAFTTLTDAELDTVVVAA